MFFPQFVGKLHIQTQQHIGHDRGLAQCMEQSHIRQGYKRYLRAPGALQRFHQ